MLLIRSTGFLLYFGRPEILHPSSSEILTNPLGWKDFDSQVSTYLKNELVIYLKRGQIYF